MNSMNENTSKKNRGNHGKIWNLIDWLVGAYATQNDEHLVIDNIEFQSIDSRPSDLLRYLVFTTGGILFLGIFTKNICFCIEWLGRFQHRLCWWIGTKKNNDKERNSISPWKRLILRKSQWFDMNSSDFIDHYWPKFRWTHCQRQSL